jgi:hypothetical protein
MLRCRDDTVFAGGGLSLVKVQLQFQEGVAKVRSQHWTGCQLLMHCLVVSVLRAQLAFSVSPLPCPSYVLLGYD